MALWHFSFLIVSNKKSPENMSIDQLCEWEPKELALSIEYLQNILPIEKSWSSAIKQYGNHDGTNIKIVFDNQQIVEISCSLDLRTLTKSLLAQVLQYIELIQGNILYNGIVYEPTMEKIIALMKQSDAGQFCTNPREYLDKLSKSKDKLKG